MRAAPRPAPPGASLRPPACRRRVAPTPSLAHLPGAPRPAAPAPCCPAVLGPAGPRARALQQQRRRLVTKSRTVTHSRCWSSSAGRPRTRRPGSNPNSAAAAAAAPEVARSPAPAPPPLRACALREPRPGRPTPLGPSPRRRSRAGQFLALASAPRFPQDPTLIRD